MTTEKTRKSKGIARTGDKSRSITKTSKRPIRIGVKSGRRRKNR